MIALEYVAENQITKMPAISDDILEVLPKNRPDALVYTIPISGVKVVTSQNEDGGWKGIAFHPEKTGSTFAWNSENLNLPLWAKSINILKAILFIVSRTDDEGLAHFRIPNTKTIISAKWENDQFSGGFITDSDQQRRQSWIRTGFFGAMDPGGPFNYNPTIRRHQNMLCRAATIKNKGLDPKIPL